MYFSKTAIVSSLVSLALAADHVPVTIVNFDPDFDIKCGGVTVAGRDIYNAVAWGMSLNENDEQLTSSDSTMMRVQTRSFLLTVQQTTLTQATTATPRASTGFQMSAIRPRAMLASTCPSSREDFSRKAAMQGNTVPSIVSIPTNEPWLSVWNIR